jgi:nucleotide-binding universal stress UspA family protein
MSARWLVAIDDTEAASNAFNYALSAMKPDDHLYLLNVSDEPTSVFVGYASPVVMETLYKVGEEKARKILVHYGHKAKQAGIRFSMMKGTSSNPGDLICKALENFGVDNCVLGRRGLGTFERFFSGSTSKYVLENANCNVIVVKTSMGPPEEHALKTKVIQAEEHERLRRIEEEDSFPAEVHDATLDQIKEAEEIERTRRMGEQARSSSTELKKFITHYQFHDDILKLGKEKEAMASGIPTQEGEVREKERTEAEKSWLKGRSETGEKHPKAEVQLEHEKQEFDFLDLNKRAQSQDLDSGAKAKEIPQVEQQPKGGWKVPHL